MKENKAIDTIRTIKKASVATVKLAWRARAERVIIPLLAVQVESTGSPFAAALLAGLATAGVDIPARKSWVDGISSGIGAAAISVLIQQFDQFLNANSTDQAEAIMVVTLCNTIPHAVLYILSTLAKQIL